MALTVEDGNIVSGANSYVSVTDFTAYLTERGSFLGGVNGSSEQVLVKAMDYIETRAFQGTKSTKDQPLQWPRAGVYVDGYSIDEDEIPNDLIVAQMETAISIDAGNNPLSTLDRETKREKVGDIEVEYSDSAKETVDLRAVDARLAKLIGISASGVVSMVRA